MLHFATVKCATIYVTWPIRFRISERNLRVDFFYA